MIKKYENKISCQHGTSNLSNDIKNDMEESWRILCAYDIQRQVLKGQDLRSQQYGTLLKNYKLQIMSYGPKKVIIVSNQC